MIKIFFFKYDSRLKLNIRLYTDNYTKYNKNILRFLADCIIRSEVHKEFGMKNCGIVLKRSEYGKPYIENGPFFSVSHTSDALCAAFCNNCIGIDMEKIRTGNFARIAERLFTQNEKNYIAEASDKNAAFLRIWTAKEAFAKMTGEGIFKHFPQIDTLSPSANIYIERFCFDEYILSICTKFKEKCTIKILSNDEIYDMLDFAVEGKLL